MASLTGLVRSTLSSVVFGAGGAQFPYQVGDPLPDQDETSLWTLHHGTRRDDQSAVTVFVFEAAKDRNRVPLAKNAYRKLRTMRHPDLLNYVDGLETADLIYIVTQPVVPLRAYLAEHHGDAQLVLWGLYKIAQALEFLNGTCQVVHGNVRASSVFVTAAGEWRLGGFEVMSKPADTDPVIKSYYSLLPDIGPYSPPEIDHGQRWEVLQDNATLGLLDAWQFACLMCEAYSNRPLRSDQDLSTAAIPSATMTRGYRQLLQPTPTTRWTVAQFRAAGEKPGGYFDTEFIRTNLFLENINVKDEQEKTAFFQQLSQHVGDFPPTFCTHKVLPELLKCLEFAAGGPLVLKAVVAIGQRLSDEEYAQHITPTIVKLFAIPDRALRFSLLECLDQFIPHATDKTMDSVIFPHVAAGFVDTAPAIREQTVKALVVMAPKLSASTLQRGVLTALTKLVHDPEPGIRTNSLICVGKLGKHFTAANHTTQVAPLFARSLRDPFSHARAAALMAISATAEYQDAKDLATKLLPVVCPALLDKDKVVRVQAAKTAQTLLKRVDAAAQEMPASSPTMSASGTKMPGINGSSGAGVALAGDGGQEGGWSGWAVSSLSRGLTALGTTMVSARLSDGGVTSTSPLVTSTASPPPSALSSASAVPPTTTGLGLNAMTSPLALDTPNDPAEANQGWQGLDDLALEESPSSTLGSQSTTIGNAHKAHAQDDWDTPWDLNSAAASATASRALGSSTSLLSAKPTSKAGLGGARPSSLQQRREDRKLKLQEHREQKKKKSLGATKLGT
ncbi:Nuclear aminoacylation-dependent tRNA export pathway component [Dimargaris verticillata]|uniref:Nuclear aminoacylation-dependent tRNA export pathway component n=1 Tax=Dimargaris verticillata TaxID=2761393 RepID=A0A9W8B0Y6_9FUNG|nr:Nuclear aminoacylation-dependent tRNA export pathway component [Dimargaris verticillata]